MSTASVHECSDYRPLNCKVDQPIDFFKRLSQSLEETTNVTPIFKSVDPTDVKDYRPISVLPVLSKIAESHVHHALYSFLSENDLIYTRTIGLLFKTQY